MTVGLLTRPERDLRRTPWRSASGRRRRFRRHRLWPRLPLLLPVPLNGVARS